MQIFCPTLSIDVTQVHFKLTTVFFIFVTTFQTLNNNDWKPKKRKKNKFLTTTEMKVIFY